MPKPQVPRYPTFGVLLGEPKPDPTGGITAAIRKTFWSQSVFKYIVSFVSTFRNFYDKDFLLIHPELSQLVKPVDTDEFNSLDFGMDLDTKKKLFAKGAETAIAQLIDFNWLVYLKSRT